MSAVDRLLTILLWAMAIGLSEAASVVKKKKKKISVGAIVAIIVIVIVVIIVVCLVLLLLKRRKAKANKANISQPPLGAPSGGGEGYPMAPGSQGQGKYEPVHQNQPPQEYQQQTNYGQPPPQPYGAPPQQQGYGQGPPASYPGGPPAHGAANDYYKP